ncbi:MULTISPECIES: hypothetical protein [Gordonia]|uniref:hypothetical protein n=1 Tax=Gordonia TaxID=2053 RepID=UPI0009AE7D26|nr:MULTISPECIES: hypothetical protein [Gordonia]MBE7192887.1 hypothetical protein [Gordonia polyisoprenivorans]MDF3284492.1 hypothetical protein [Gordonia sp. N1V]OPX13599.1 hypothetical protein B1964_19405 [Gordonia sp. i37]OZC32315.1 hypothetical protein CJJ17_13010 [Gordonia polyisoprenivorans]UZF55697.1 hypothetical protein LH935_23820 [Gordonia polyisoprenivorans]
MPTRTATASRTITIAAPMTIGSGRRCRWARLCASWPDEERDDEDRVDEDCVDEDCVDEAREESGRAEPGRDVALRVASGVGGCA